MNYCNWQGGRMAGYINPIRSTLATTPFVSNDRRGVRNKDHPGRRVNITQSMGDQINRSIASEPSRIRSSPEARSGGVIIDSIYAGFEFLIYGLGSKREDRNEN